MKDEFRRETIEICWADVAAAPPIFPNTFVEIGRIRSRVFHTQKRGCSHVFQRVSTSALTHFVAYVGAQVFASRFPQRDVGDGKGELRVMTFYELRLNVRDEK